MILTKKQREDFDKAARVMMKYLGENHHPHVTVVIDSGKAEILESSATLVTDEYVGD